MSVHKLKKILTFLTASLSFWLVKAALFIDQAHAQTDTWTGVCVGSETEGDPAYQVATIQGFQCLVGNLLQVAITLIGIAGFIMLLYGSFKYMISSGQAKDSEAVRNTLTYAVVGLIVALSSFFIIRIIASFTGVDTILEFKIPDVSQ